MRELRRTNLISRVEELSEMLLTPALEEEEKARERAELVNCMTDAQAALVFPVATARKLLNELASELTALDVNND